MGTGLALRTVTDADRVVFGPESLSATTSVPRCHPVMLEHWDDLILRDAPFYQDGYYVLSDKPGLGIELNEEVCRRNLVEGSTYFRG
jgi:L-alanine-DL-glutamate epimerase-like enolase superfamily enzyme